MLISETHFTEKSYIHIPQYTLYHTNHPAGTAQGGTAIILKNSIQHRPLNPYNQAFLQATSVAVEDTAGLLTVSVVYFPPKHTVHQDQLEKYCTFVSCRTLLLHFHFSFRLLCGTKDGKKSESEVEKYYYTLGHRFISGGDYNAKHTNLGSRLTSPRGQVLLKTL
jgi:hypothetical protein